MARVAVSGIIAYAVLVLFLRLSGKRTLSKLNAFDLVVTVALGSTLSSVVLSKQVPVAEGVLALGLLIFLQYTVSWCSVRSAVFRRLVKNEPVLLLYEGALLARPVYRARLTREEIEATVRSSGIEDLADLRAVVLETDGTLSVVPGKKERPVDSTLASLPRSERAA